MENRPSFSKNKIGQYITGNSGVTGTSESSAQPTSELHPNYEGKFNASELLFKNIDKLAAFVNHQEDNILDTTNEENEEDFNIDDFTEEELAQNLELHFGNQRVPAQTETTISHNIDKFCRSCGQKFLVNDNFCGNCGLKRNKAN